VTGNFVELIKIKLLYFVACVTWPLVALLAAEHQNNTMSRRFKSKIMQMSFRCKMPSRLQSETKR